LAPVQNKAIDKKEINVGILEVMPPLIHHRLVDPYLSLSVQVVMTLMCPWGLASFAYVLQ
jgi:hypothetical protein